MTEPREYGGFFPDESDPDDDRDNRRSTAAVVLGTFGALVVAGAMTLAIVFAFGEGADEPTAVPQPAPVTTDAATPSPPADAPTPQSASTSTSPTPQPTPVSFSSPSGNIVCTVAADRADCQISAYDYDPPAPGECPGDATWGDWVEVTAAGSAWTCHYDTMPAGTDVLAYGDQVTVGDFTCASARTGVTCRHDPSDASFLVARAGVDLTGMRER